MSDRLTEDVTKFQGRFNSLKAEVGKVLVGQDEMLHRLMLGLLAGGHVLLEGVPGLAKTLVVKTLADAINGTFSRIQFTPDMLPGDVVGTQIYNPREGSYTVKKGPVFGNFILADEINRAPAKVQSALLEAMQERQVTLGDQTFRLADPFLVLATQNPIESEGVYPLPEAQRDRFLMKIVLGYPSPLEEVEIVQRVGVSIPIPNQVVTVDEVIALQQAADATYVDRSVLEYAVNLVLSTRTPENFGLADLNPYIEFGASPRASLGLVRAARAIALLRGRSYAIPQDVFDVAPEILRHRIVLSYEALAAGIDSEALLGRILSTVPAPRVTPSQATTGDAWYGAGTDNRAWSA